MKRILVTGAAGQIGTELVPALLERYDGAEVVASDIKEGSAALPEGARFERLDCTDAAAVRRVGARGPARPCLVTPQQVRRWREEFGLGVAGDLHRVGEAVFLYSVQFSGRGLGTACFIADLITGAVLVGIRIRPPLIECILAYEQFEQIAPVVILGHPDLIPADDHLTPIPYRAHAPWRAVHIASDRLQVELLVGNR